jgi:spermidine/putrescine transport system permease protein
MRPLRLTVFFKVVRGLLTFITYSLIYIPILIIAFLSVNASQRDSVFTRFSFVWYREILNNERLLVAIQNTLTIAFLATIIATVIGTLAAIGIHSLSRKKRVQMMLLNNVPVVNPDIVTGISLLLVFSLLPLSFGMQTMLLAHIFFCIPFVVLSVLPKLKTLDLNLFDAAVDLGASKVKALWYVIIPSIKVGIIAGALIAFTMSIDDFVISYFVYGDGYQNVSIWIYSRLGRRTFSPSVYAYNTLIVLGTMFGLIIFNVVSQRKKIEGENI